MQITKEQIIEVLNGYAYQQKSCELDRFIIDADFSSVADEILTLLQSNDAGQPNGSKPHVSGALPPADDLERLYEWIMDENRRPANTAFTSDLLRKVADEIAFRLWRQRWSVYAVRIFLLVCSMPKLKMIDKKLIN